MLELLCGLCKAISSHTVQCCLGHQNIFTAQRVVLRNDYKIEFRWAHVRGLDMYSESPPAVGAPDSKRWRHATATT